MSYVKRSNLPSNDGTIPRENDHGPGRSMYIPAIHFSMLQSCSSYRTPQYQREARLPHDRPPNG